MAQKICHLCDKPLQRKSEQIFSHCFECNLKRLEKLTPDFEPCKHCRNYRSRGEW